MDLLTLLLSGLAELICVWAWRDETTGLGSSLLTHP